MQFKGSQYSKRCGFSTRAYATREEARKAMASRTRLILAMLLALGAGSIGNAQNAPWPAQVANYKAPEPGEHPRLLFRKSDLPALRERAKTPEGKAILDRFRKCLNGSDGETLPTSFNPEKGVIDKDGS